MAPRKRKIFYSFHYAHDAWRAAQIRNNIDEVEGNQPVTDDEWEEVTRRGDRAIGIWVEEQLHGRSCTVVLIGAHTAGRKWISHEIVRSWNDGMGVVGIYVDGLEDERGLMSERGENPFEPISLVWTGQLSDVVKCYEPVGQNSQERILWIQQNIADIALESIRIRVKN